MCCKYTAAPNEASIQSSWIMQQKLMSIKTCIILCYTSLKWPSGIGLNNYSYVVNTYAIVPETVAIFLQGCLVVQSKYNQSRYVLLSAVPCM